MATPAQPPFVDSDLGFLLAQASHALHGRLAPDLDRAGLGALEWRVLAVLHGGPLTVGALARAALTRQPTLTKCLPQLARAGWVRLEADDGDARRTRVVATAAGKRKAAALMKKAQAVDGNALAGFSVSEQRALRAALFRLAQA